MSQKNQRVINKYAKRYGLPKKKLMESFNKLSDDKKHDIIKRTKEIMLIGTKLINRKTK